MRVRTTRQARGLQRCSTRTCGCCGKQGRGWNFGAITTEQWALSADGSHMSASVTTMHCMPACAKHETARGVFIHPRASGQVMRVIVDRDAHG